MRRFALMLTIAAVLGACGNALNAGDETPGSVRYATWWSPCDEIINPDESVILSGASNHKTACLTHVGLTTDETVYKEVREFVK